MWFSSGAVEGRADNIKVTRPEDLALAEFYLTRTIHREKAYELDTVLTYTRLAEKADYYYWRRAVPYEKGLLAHSDGDVALHALTDALLAQRRLAISASFLPGYRSAFVERIAANYRVKPRRRIQAKGYTLGNVDVTIIAQAPKIAAYSANASLSPKILAAI
ncbi:2-C-methyl-D-erythritol 2,4-cyclodiphosphate synthase [Salmonella enterica subsp. enterica serovar Weltevreden]|nr:2-C-methyl-D-erythritol 2,4-cyclodiphosphate synthase [Salmonella enterica subsp. enterica serovar Weltevreden]